MPLAACPRCGRIVREQGETYCPEHKPDPNRSWSKDRDRGAQKRFRKAVIALVGERCCALVEGVRCSETTRLQAHHLEPGNDDPHRGVMLCSEHHRAVDVHAR